MTQKCSRCGAALEGFELFCPECGLSLQKNAGFGARAVRRSDESAPVPIDFGDENGMLADPIDFGDDLSDASDSVDFGNDFADTSDPVDFGDDFADAAAPVDFGDDFADASDPFDLPADEAEAYGDDYADGYDYGEADEYDYEADGYGETDGYDYENDEYGEYADENGEYDEYSGEFDPDSDETDNVSYVNADGVVDINDEFDDYFAELEEEAAEDDPFGEAADSDVPTEEDFEPFRDADELREEEEAYRGSEQEMQDIIAAEDFDVPHPEFDDWVPEPDEDDPWGANDAAPRKRGLMKFVILAVLIAAVGLAAANAYVRISRMNYEFNSALQTYFDAVLYANPDKFIETRPPEYITYLTSKADSKYANLAAYRTEKSAELYRRLADYTDQFGDVRAIRYQVDEASFYTSRAKEIGNTLASWYGFENPNVEDVVSVNGSYTVQGVKASGTYALTDLLLIKLNGKWYFAPDVGSYWKENP